MLQNMSDVAAEAKKILETMLGKLGFEHEIEVNGDEDHLTLNILSPDQTLLIGKGRDKARGIADKVKASGDEIWMTPMNSYHRRLVHNALADDPEIESVSEDSNMRNKKILIRLK